MSRKQNLPPLRRVVSRDPSIMDCWAKENLECGHYVLAAAAKPAKRRRCKACARQDPKTGRQ